MPRTMLYNLTNTHTPYIFHVTFRNSSKNYYPHCTQRKQKLRAEENSSKFTQVESCKLFCSKEGSLNKMRDKQDPYKSFPPPISSLVAGSEEDFKIELTE